MDPLSISAGVAGFLSLAMEISKILAAYVGDVKSAPEEVHNLRTEVSSLCSVLEQLARLLLNDVKGNFKPTSALVTVIEACQDQIKGLYRKLETLHIRRDKKVIGLIDRLKWPLKKEDYENTLVTLHRFSQTFQFSLTVANCELLAKSSAEVLSTFQERQNQLQKTLESFKSMQLPIEELKMASKKQSDTFDAISAVIEIGLNIQNKIWAGVQGIQEKLDEEEMKKLLSWISPVEPQKRHQDVRSKRLQSTGNWFLETENFRNWRDDKGSDILGCYGIPGSGKTFISSLVIDHLSTTLYSENILVSFIYCDYRDRKRQTTANLLGGLLKQAIIASQNVPAEVINRLLPKMKNGVNVELNDVLEALSTMFQSFDKIYLCIDALDECTDEYRWSLLNHLKTLSNPDESHLLSVKLFFTGRPQMKDYVNSHSDIVSPRFVALEANSDDIAAYVAYELKMDTKVKMSDDFKNQIIAEIVAASQGMFLLPALQIEAVLDEITIRKRRKALQEMPKALQGAFKITMERIQNQKLAVAKQAMDVLKWIFLATEPLRLEALRHALAVEPDDEALDCENFVDKDFLLPCCLGLVIIDESTSTVRLVHKSLQDYLKTQYEKNQLFLEGHDEIALICLKYISFDEHDEEITAPCGLGCEFQKKYALIEYATCNWVYHARKARSPHHAIEEVIFGLLLAKYHSHSVFRYLLSWSLFKDYYPSWGHFTSVSFERKQLHQGGNDKKYCLLHVIASIGLEKVLSRFIESQAVNINNQEHFGRTPLSIAAQEGFEALVPLFLETEGIDVNAKDNRNTTPLSWAARNGHVQVVKLLLKAKNLDLNSKDLDFGYTSLCWAAERGHTEVVKVLLENECVDVDSKSDKYGRTALALAAQNGHEKILELLLKTSRIDINEKDEICGQTPLSLAAEGGHTDALQLLLQVDDVDINTKDYSYRMTPLLRSAAGGHTETFKVLLDPDGIDSKSVNSEGRTPLFLAAENGQIKAVKMLLEIGGVDINSKQGWFGETVLCLASRNGYVGIVKEILKICGVELESKDGSDGRTPLHQAAQNGHREVMELLLEREDIDVNAKDNEQNTPLILASISGKTEVVKVLLQNHRVDFNVKDSDGWTPLSWAIDSGHLEVAELLLEKDGVNINIQDLICGQSPIFRAVQKGNYSTIQWLLERDSIDVNLQDDYGKTALSWAADGGRVEIVRLLLEKDGINLNLKDLEGYTALMRSIDCSPTLRGVRNRPPFNLELLRLILSQGDIDINCKAKDGSTVLSLAIMHGLEEAVDILRKHGAV